MTTQSRASSHLVVDARYTLSTADDFIILIAQDRNGRWAPYDPHAGTWLLEERWATSGGCYFELLSRVEEAEERDALSAR